MSIEQVKPRMNDITVGATDILFECPACGKSLVVDETAEGLIVDCPQCRTNVVVPPKSDAPTPALSSTSTTTKESVKPRDEERVISDGDSPQARLASLSDQLKEMQTQRTEITSRIASRLNDVNRDLVMLARLGTSQQQVLTEWNQLVEKTFRNQEAELSEQPVVVGSSIPDTERTRVTPRPR